MMECWWLARKKSHTTRVAAASQLKVVARAGHPDHHVPPSADPGLAGSRANLHTGRGYFRIS